MGVLEGGVLNPQDFGGNIWGFTLHTCFTWSTCVKLYTRTPRQIRGNSIYWKLNFKEIFLKFKGSLKRLFGVSWRDFTNFRKLIVELKWNRNQ